MPGMLSLTSGADVSILLPICIVNFLFHSFMLNLSIKFVLV